MEKTMETTIWGSGFRGLGYNFVYLGFRVEGLGV